MTKYNEYLLTDGQEFTLEESRFNILKEKTEKLVKKFGDDFISINSIKEEFKRDLESGIIYKYITFTLNKIFSHLNDWKVLARKSNINNSVIIDVFEDSAVISKYRNNDFSCDHCSTKRFRKSVFIIQNTISGEVKQIGKSCLKDFTGESITRFLKEIDSIQSLFEFEEISLGVSSGYFDLVNFFAMVNRLIKKGIPYKNKSFLFDSTVKKSFEDYSKDNLPLSNEEKEESRKIMNWFVELNKSSDKDFILNAVSIIENVLNNNQLVNYELLSRVAFVPYSYRNYQDRHNQNKLASNSIGFRGGYLKGNINDKVNLEVRLISIKPVLRQSYSYYDEGLSYLYTLLDNEGHKIIWFSSYENKFFKKENLNRMFKVKGKIKKFSKFNDLEQTEITRCFVTMV